MRKLPTVTLLFAFVLATAGACTGTDTDPDVDAVAEARAHFQSAVTSLQSAAYLTATTELEHVFESKGTTAALERLDPNLLSRIHFVYGVAFLLRELDKDVGTIAELIDILAPLFDRNVATDTDAAPASADIETWASATFLPQQEARGFERLLDDLLRKLRVETIGILELHLTEAARNSSFSMTLRPLPVRLGGIDVADFGGEFDLADIYFLRMVLSSLAGTLDGLRALVLRIDVGSLLSLGIRSYAETYLDFEDKQNNTVEMLNLAALIFYVSDNLLGVEDEGLLRKAAEEQIESLDWLAKAIEVARTEVLHDLDQDDDVFGYYRTATEETVRLQIEGTLKTDAVDLTRAQPLVIHITSELLDAIANIKAASTTPGTYLIWSRDIVPLISVALVALLPTGLFDGVIEAALDQSELSEASKGAIAETLHVDLANVSLAQGLLSGIIPDIFRINLYRYIQHPVGPRALVPMWSIPDASTLVNPASPLQEVRFMFDYECEEAGVPYDPLSNDAFVCPAGYRVDSDHFASAGYASILTNTGLLASNDVEASNVIVVEAGWTARTGFARDGYISLLPAVLLHDPSVGGVLEVNFDGEESITLGDVPYASSWTVANQRSVNALAGLISSQLKIFFQ